MDVSPSALAASYISLFISIISIVSTLFAILAYFHSISIRNAHQNLLLLNLLFNALLFAIKNAIFSGHVSFLKNADLLMGYGCSLDGFLNFFCGGMEIQTLTYIALERYFAIKRQKSLHLKQILTLLTIGWVSIGFMTSLPLWLPSYRFVPLETNISCFLPLTDQTQLTVNLISVIPVPLFIGVICYCYTKVYLFYRSAGRRRHLTQEKSTVLASNGFKQEVRRNEEDKERKVFLTTVLLVGWTLLGKSRGEFKYKGWSSMLIMMAYAVITGIPPSPEWELTSFMLTRLTLCGDSIILMVSDKRWKASLKGMFSRWK